ncbi:MAG: type II toxin-antitoxin system RelE/ParE family toxin [Deltaproteobacteria bacterium]|nr:type II toxin-antitoxin system RelE/ParE family toxin [Deltaproteobacteria bacterium]
MKKIQRRYTLEAKRLIQKLPPEIKVPIRALADEILQNPQLGKRLKKPLEGFLSARYSHYRILYEYVEKEGLITINYVG